MTLPLVMTGPGGDYVNQYHAQGTRIVKSHSQQGDTESNGGHTAWGKLPKRRGASTRDQVLSVSPAAVEVDRFEHTEPAPQPGLYRPNSADPTRAAAGALSAQQRRPHPRRVRADAPDAGRRARRGDRCVAAVATPFARADGRTTPAAQTHQRRRPSAGRRQGASRSRTCGSLNRTAGETS